MRVSLAWLQEFVRLDRPPREVAAALTARGLPVDAVEETADGPVLEIDVPANRPDGLGHLGIAREAAAAFGVPLRWTDPASPDGEGEPVGRAVRVEIEAPELCGRYTAGIVRGIRIGPSPAPLAARVEACGLRSINNAVDVSNLVMLALGQPVHFFDLAKIRGGRILVRRSSPGERLTTLDGNERALPPGSLVIADAEGPVALAGVIGGAESEIGEGTRDILVEAAWFSPAAVRELSRALGLVTDASQRFARGCDPEAPPRAQGLAAKLLADLAGGSPAPKMLDAYPGRSEPRVLSVRLSRAEGLLGFPVSRETAGDALGAVGLAPVDAGEDAIEVRIPSWRVDLEREADLVEEIGRHVGYDRVPSRIPVGPPVAPNHPPPEVEEIVRDHLAQAGFHEALSYAMIAEGEDAPFLLPGVPPPVPVANPIAEGLCRLRRSLLPGLLRSADRNLRRGIEDVRLFEVGRVFLLRGHGEFPEEPLRVGFAWSGAAAPRHWSRPPQLVDLWDAAGRVEAILACVRPVATSERSAGTRPGFHPGRAVSWRVEEREAAWCGEVHPDLAARLGLPAPVWLAEIDLDALLALPDPPRAYRPLPRVPGVERDLSVVLEKETPARALLERVRALPSPAPASFAVVDRYEGPPLGEGESAVTLRVILQPLERTLGEEAIEGYRLALVRAIQDGRGMRLRE